MEEILIEDGISNSTIILEQGIKIVSIHVLQVNFIFAILIVVIL